MLVSHSQNKNQGETTVVENQVRSLRNSDRIKIRYGSYNIDIIDNDINIRVSKLYSTQDGLKTNRTLAVTSYPDVIDPAFAKELASLADVYVSDAFGSAHRAHASTEGITQYLPAVAGFLLAKEIEFFDKALSNPERPFVAILGGAKVSDKILVIENLLEKVDTLLIGGGMAYTFLKAQGHTIGGSKLDKEGLGLAEDLLTKAKAKGVELMLPEDHVVANEFSETADAQPSEIDIADGWMALDIGPKTIESFKKVLATAQTIVWNGPLGVFEFEKFKKVHMRLRNASLL